METELHRSFPDNKLISAVAYIGVSRVAPGKIVQDGTAKLTLGLYPEGDAPEIEEFVRRGIRPVWSAGPPAISNW